LNSKKTLEEIREFWEASANAPVDTQGLRPTARDPYLQLAVEDAIEVHLWQTARLLDVGCGDGQSTIRFAKHVALACGVDYIASFVNLARQSAAKEQIGNVSFRQGDVTDLSIIRDELEPFDIVTSIRCLINLPTWTLQAKGLAEIASCISAGGLCICSEGWEEGMNGLNELRLRCGLAPIDVVAYNLLIARRDFEAEAAKYFDVVSYQGLGLYIFISRIFHPYFKLPDPPEHAHKLNRVGRELQKVLRLSGRFDDVDFAGVYVLRRK
jgi:SAM-dependent methyltransferase